MVTRVSWGGRAQGGRRSGRTVDGPWGPSRAKHDLVVLQKGLLEARFNARERRNLSKYLHVYACRSTVMTLGSVYAVLEAHSCHPN